MTRHVEPELLDELPPDDPYALGSRRDLVRLNAWMGHSRLMARTLEPSGPGPRTTDHGTKRSAVSDQWSVALSSSRRLVELGAGDGQFLLSVAQRLSSAWKGTTAFLVDRHSVVSPDTQQAFKALGWCLELIEADVFDWLNRPTVGFCDVVLANLFLHHFAAAQLTRLMSGAAHLANTFVALEPHRATWPLTCSHFVWLIGCNRVTQNDAPVSVRAGFAGDELSRYWPEDGRWALEERRAGWCSHLFTARRNSDGLNHETGLKV
jgi:hypothetical protein